MDKSKFISYKIYSNFLNKLAKELTSFYYKKLDRPFKVINKSKKKGYDPVTLADKSFEKFIRSKINKKFPDHQIIGEELGYKKTKSDFTWILDPIDGTRSFILAFLIIIFPSIVEGSNNLCWVPLSKNSSPSTLSLNQKG